MSSNFNLLHAILPVHKISRIFDLISTPLTSKNSIVLDLIFTIIRILLIILLIIFGQNYCSVSVTSKTNSMILLKYLDFYQNATTAIIVNIVESYYYRLIRNIIFDIRNTDKILNKIFGVQLCDKEIYKHTKIILISEVLIIIFVYSQQIYDIITNFELAHFCYFVCQFITIYTITVASLKFTLLLYIIQNRFYLLNNFIKNSTFLNLGHLKYICVVHRLLKNLAKTVNNTHNLHMLLKMLISFMTLLFNVYKIMLHFFYGKNIDDLQNVLRWTVYLCAELTAITYICTSICLEAGYF